MMCEEGCAATVKDILENQPGVQDVRVNFDAKTATVAVDEDELAGEDRVHFGERAPELGHGGGAVFLDWIDPGQSQLHGRRWA